MNDVVYLITKKYLEDEIGQDVSEITEQEVFCEILSISQSEFFEAAQSGLKPQYKIKVWAEEYGGQDEVRIGDDFFTVYRNYTVNGMTELYLEKRGGAQ